jgi:competence protein ComEC
VTNKSSKSRALPRKRQIYVRQGAAAAGYAIPSHTVESPYKALPNAVTNARGLAKALSKATDSAGFGTAMSVAKSVPDNLRVHFIPVGAGSCQIIECPGSDDVIVNDCGQLGKSPNSWDLDDIQSYVASVVGSDQPAVVVSHADFDHYAYIPSLIDPSSTEVVLFGGIEEDFGDDMREWLSRVPGTRLRHGWEAGYHEEIPELRCGVAKVHMLTVNIEGSKNANSLVLGIQHSNTTVILTGDAEDVTQDSAMTNYPQLTQNVTLLSASHHGARTHGSNNAPWANHTAPSIIVYSSGVKYGHPSASIVPNYQGTLLDVPAHPMWTNAHYADEINYDSAQAEYVTELNGLIVFESDGNAVGLACQYQDDPCF